jgi:hypothetical protein
VIASRRARGGERSFGLSVGGVLLVISAVLLWRGRIRSGEIAAVAAVPLVVLGALRPAWLAWPCAMWWRFALLLGHVNARVILTVAFAVVLTPIGLLWRALGRDPLARNRRTWPGWVSYPPRYAAPDHYKRMY